ncbi:MAG: IS66 family insertion sequence element accessory protein TnpB [bacterium]|nr:IS66 family insertion sequence element accessory protein TnpB [bacterium]
MSTRPNPDTAKRMRALVGELEESGLSLAAFARMKGEPTWRLYGWRRRLKRKSPASEPAFVPVRIVDAPNPPAPLEIELGCQRRILVPPGFDEAALQRLVRVLEAC